MQSQSKPSNTAASVRKKTFLFHFKATNGNISAACDEAGVTRRTYNRWLLEPNFNDEIEETRGRMIDNLRSAVYRYGLENGELALKILERLDPDTWRVKRDDAGDGYTGPVTVTVRYID